MRNEVLLTICLMALATIVARLGGLWLMGQIKMSPFIERWFKGLPGALLTAIVTPHIINGGMAEMITAIVVVLTMTRTKSLLLAMFAGITTVFIVKNILL